MDARLMGSEPAFEMHSALNSGAELNQTQGQLT